MLSVRRAGVEPAQPVAAALQSVGLTNAQPTHGFKWHRRESNPQSPRFELGRFADLRTVPCLFSALPDGLLLAWAVLPGMSSSALDGIWTRDLLRDRQASTPGCSTRACRSSGSGGSRTHSIPGSKPRWSAGCLPSRSAQSGSRTRKRSGLSRAALPRWRIWAEVVLGGLEPIVTL